MSKHGLKIDSDTEGRRFRRVKVGLQGALRIPGLGVEMVHTRDISEGGIGLYTIGGCDVDVGSKVQLHLNGIVSSEAKSRLETYEMEVIYSQGGDVGLTFI